MVRGPESAAHIRVVNPPDKTSARRLRTRCSVTALAVTLSIPLTGASQSPFLPPPSPAAESVAVHEFVVPPQQIVTVAPDAPMRFARESVTSFHDPELKLDVVMSTLGTVKAPDTADTLSDPLAQVNRTSAFGRRTSPITGDPTEFHSGQDFGAPCGTGVKASAEGTVTYARWHPHGGGNRVEVTHRDGLVTTYNHMEPFGVKLGQKLARGEALGKVGTTGASTGCHLHFEVVLNGKHVDPLPWL